MEESYPLRYRRYLRRIYDRFRVESAATLIVNRGLEKPAVLRDLSIRGAGLICRLPLKVNGIVAIIIRAPFFEGPVYRKAKVVWSKQLDKGWWRAGLDFGLENKIKFT
jgi:hypothetical protein